MDNAKKIIAHFLKISPESIKDETKMDYTVIASSLIQHRMYALLADNGYIVDDPGSIITFKDFKMMARTSIQNPITTTSKEDSFNTDLNSTISGQNIQNIGIDIEDISSFPESENYNLDRFYLDNFSLNEIEYCKSKVNPKNSFAAIFSLKESIIKADNSLKRFPFNEIEIKHNIERKPEYDGFLLSNSHSKGNVVSVAIKNNAFAYQKSSNAKKILTSDDFFSKKEVLFVGFFTITISILINYL